MMKDEDKFKIATKEIFAPFYVVTEYKDEDLPQVLDVLGKSCKTSLLVEGFEPRVEGIACFWCLGIFMCTQH
jgi:hypothetical protein